MITRRWLFLLAGLMLAAGLACSGQPPTPFAPPPAAATATRPATLTPAPPTVTPPPDSGWQEVAAGLEQRTWRVSNAAGDVIEVVHLLRVDPASYHFEIAYAPGEPRMVQEWAAQTGAAVTFNAGYFTPDHTATGLLVANGVAHGSSYGGFAGMLAVTAAGVEVRWLENQPYDPAEPLQAAVQSFPVLIQPGGVLGFPEEDGMPSRRTVTAQDRAGRILVIVCPNGTFTLHGLATYLLQSDLDLEIALNLDGGTSTGLIMAYNEKQIAIPSYVPVPAVVQISPK